MNRTIEQWEAINQYAFACNASFGDVRDIVEQAVSDLQELAQQLETERIAWSAKRAELLRNHDAELARRKAAEAQRDYALNELEFIANTNDIDSALDPDRAIRVAKTAVKFIKEQTK